MALRLRNYQDVFAFCNCDSSLKVLQKRGRSDAYFLGFDDEAILALVVPDFALVGR